MGWVRWSTTHFPCSRCQIKIKYLKVFKYYYCIICLVSKETVKDVVAIQIIVRTHPPLK